MSEMGMEIAAEMVVAAVATAFPDCPVLQAACQNQQTEEDQSDV
jgi:hypothetical protein